MVTSPYASAASARNFVNAADFAPAIGSIGSLFVKAAKMNLMSANVAATDTGGQELSQQPAQVPASQPAQTSPSPTSIDGAAQALSDVQQKFVVGSGVISFDQGVTADRRKAALHSTLFALLSANKAYPDPKQPGYADNWTRTYNNALLSIGWVPQSTLSGKTPSSGSNATVEVAILKIAENLIGATGVAAIRAIIDGLEALSTNSAPIVLFKQSVESADVLQFSASLSSTDPNGDFSVKTLLFEVSATNTHTQVLFFDWSTTDADIIWKSSMFSLDDDVYAACQATLVSKIQAFTDQISLVS